jgi:hypothetical protein
MLVGNFFEALSELREGRRIHVIHVPKSPRSWPQQMLLAVRRAVAHLKLRQTRPR